MPAALVLSLSCNHRDESGSRLSRGPLPSPAVNAEDPQSGPVRSSALLDRDIDWNRTPVLERLGRIAETMTSTGYAPTPRVNEREGIYMFDFSAMAEWVLRRAAPRAAAAVARGLGHRPLAADFARRIAAIPRGRDRQGWRRVARVEDLEPGDVVAWVKPAIVESKNTGHVAFVALPPVRVPGYADAYLVRIVDSTNLLHDDDTREGRSGFGLGTILLVTNVQSGEPIAYGWVGLKWRTFETAIAMGRPME